MNGSPAVAHSAHQLQEMDAQKVLNQTRRELREFLMGEPAPVKSGQERQSAKIGTSTRPMAQPTDRGARTRRQAAASNRRDGIDWLGLAKAGASTWWRGHPLHVGATVITPVVNDYVRRKPVATLAVAAAAGAALVLIRPWRIASVSALGMSLVRSSNLPVMAASLVASVAENLQKDQS